MNVFDAIKLRRSVRSFQAKEIPEESLNKVLEAFRLAPSANNEQPWKLIVITDDAVKQDMIKACRGQRFIAEASCILVACGMPNSSKIGGYTSSLFTDLGLAINQLFLAAHAEGLGTCFIGSFDEYEVKKILNIPEMVHVIGITPLGFPAKKAGEEGLRKPLEEIVYYNKYGEK